MKRPFRRTLSWIKTIPFSFRTVKGLNAELSEFYQSPSLWGVYKTKGISSISAGLQKKSKNEKNTYSLNLSDLFKSSVFYVSANITELDI